MLFHGFIDELVKLGAVSKIKELTRKKDILSADILESTVFNDEPGDIPKNSKYFGKFDSDGDLIGMVRLNMEPTKVWKKDTLYQKIKKMNPEVAISAIAVRPEHRRQGIAKQMRAHLQDRFSSILTATDSNESNIPAMERLNEKMGFRPFAKRKHRTFYFWEKSE